MNESPPFILLFPYLPLLEPLEFGPWWLGPLQKYTGTWLSPEFEAAARAFGGAFRMAHGSVLGNPALLVRRDSGANGQRPTPAEREAIRLAVGFGVIERNPYWSPEAQHRAHQVTTSDNADYWEQPLNPEGWIALERGSRVETTVGGLNLNDEGFAVPVPLELHMPFGGIRLDPVVVEAMYQVLVNASTGSEASSASIRVATRWLLKSWQNTPSISWEDRLIFVKVATEALTGKDKNTESAKKLEAILASAAEQEGEGIGSDDLLWQPNQPSYVRHWTDGNGKPRSEEMSAFQHWAMALGDVRNALVHGEDCKNHNYEQNSSPYNGSFVEVGDRVVREAIAILLGECGHPEAWRHGFDRARLQVWRHLKELGIGEAD